MIFKVQRGLVEKKEKLIYVYLGYEKPNYVTCMLWNGKPGQARTLEFDCATREEALAKIEEVAKEYPNSSKITGIDIDGNTMISIDIDSNDTLLIEVDYGEDQ